MRNGVQVTLCTQGVVQVNKDAWALMDKRCCVDQIRHHGIVGVKNNAWGYKDYVRSAALVGDYV